MTRTDLELTLVEARSAGIRFIVKNLAGKYRVYDTVIGSYPGARPGLGAIKQDVTKPEAQAEAERLNGV